MATTGVGSSGSPVAHMGTPQVVSESLRFLLLAISYRVQHFQRRLGWERSRG
jgi:hypothetical protein